MTDALINGIVVFVLASFVGFEVITKVPSLLHPPLTSPSRRWYRAPPWAGVGRLPLAKRSACGLPPPLTGRLLAPSATGAFQVPLG